jgi:hypothetical protein
MSLSGASAGTSVADMALSFDGLLVCLGSLSLVLCLLLPLLLLGLLDANPLGRSGCASKPNWIGVGGRSGSSLSTSFCGGGRLLWAFGCACFDLRVSSFLL